MFRAVRRVVLHRVRGQTGNTLHEGIADSTPLHSPLALWRVPSHWRLSKFCLRPVKPNYRLQSCDTLPKTEGVADIHGSILEIRLFAGVSVYLDRLPDDRIVEFAKGIFERKEVRIQAPTRSGAGREPMRRP